MAQLNDLLVAGASRLLNGLGILGSTNADSIFPNVTDTYALGSSDKRWNTLYAKTSNIDTQTVNILTVNTYATIGNGAAATGTGTGVLRVTGGLSATQNSWFGKSIIMTPASGVGIKIGAATITAASTTNGEIVLQNGHLRFGTNNWDYNKWAGLKYDATNKIIYLGLADGTVFTANAAQSGGTLALPGVRYLSINGKEVIDAVDTWLRINQNKTYSAGTYFGQSIVRTDNQFQVGDGGSKFYANSSGNGYFSNTLGVGGTNTNYKIYTNGKTKVGDGAASTSTSTGALQVGGGIGVSGNSYFGGSITIANNILPEATNTRILGSSSKYWKEAYITTMYGSADKVDGYHFAESVPWTNTNSYSQPTASTIWYLKISTAVWNSTSETIYIKASGDNRNGTVVLKTGSRQGRWFGWATSYNGTCVTGVKKVVTNSDDVYIRLDAGTTSVTVKTTFSPTITIVTDADNYIGVPSDGGLFGNTVSFSTFSGNLNGNVTGNVTGNSTTSSYPLGFSSASTANAGWGNQTGTTNVCWNDSTGGSVDWRRDNPSSGKVSMKVDGRVYINEGGNPVMGMTSANGYWGMGDPDAGTSNWIRTTSNGILPYQSGGASSLGTSSWPFNAIYATNFYGTFNGNSSTTTLLKPTDNTGTTTYKVSTWAANTAGAYIVWREAFQNSNLGSDTGDILLWLNGATTLNITIDGNYYANASDLVLTSGNYSSYAAPASHGHYINAITWYGSQNLKCYDTDTEWSIDMDGTATNSYFHIWSGIKGNSCMKFENNTGLCRAPYGVYGGVWNDYAEYRAQKETIEPGYCVASSDDGKIYKTSQKLQSCDGIVSDTFGFAIGETEESKTPLAVAGRVLAYCDGNRYDYHAGDTVCAGPEGKVMKMSRQEIAAWPDRIVGIVSEIPNYKTWGQGNVEVNGRIWIKVK